MTKDEIEKAREAARKRLEDPAYKSKEEINHENLVKKENTRIRKRQIKVKHNLKYPYEIMFRIDKISYDFLVALADKEKITPTKYMRKLLWNHLEYVRRNS